MTMKPRRSPWALLVWPLSLLGILFLIWISGYLYWQIRISRAIAELKKGPAKYTNQMFYADPELLDIGSRGILSALHEWDEAISAGNADLAFAFNCGLQDLLRGAAEVSAEAAKSSGSYTFSRERPTMLEMQQECKDFLENWQEYKEWYAPWWQWWNGHELRRGHRRWR